MSPGLETIWNSGQENTYLAVMYSHDARKWTCEYGHQYLSHTLLCLGILRSLWLCLSRFLFSTWWISSTVNLWSTITWSTFASWRQSKETYLQLTTPWSLCLQPAYLRRLACCLLGDWSSVRVCSLPCSFRNWWSSAKSLVACWFALSEIGCLLQNP